MRVATITATSLAALLAVAGCSGPSASPAEEGEGAAQQMSTESSPGADTASSEPSETSDLPSDEDLQEYMEAIASTDVSTIDEARELTKEGAVADAYLTFHGHRTQALIDAGMVGLASQTLESTDEGLDVCLDGEPEECSTFADFSGEDGKLQSFTVDGEALDERLILGDGGPVSDDQGSAVSPVFAYKAASDDTLLVGYDLRSGDQDILYTTATYRGPDGRQSESSTSIGTVELAADSLASHVVSFPGAELGGELTVDVGYENTGRPAGITVPITAE